MGRPIKGACWTKGNSPHYLTFRSLAPYAPYCGATSNPIMNAIHVVSVWGGKPLLSNDDGVTWNEISTFPSKVYDGCCYDMITRRWWFTCYYEGIFYSDDLVTLHPAYSITGTLRPRNIAANNGRVVVALEQGGGNATTYLYSSDNGTTFSYISTGFSDTNNAGCCYDSVNDSFIQWARNDNTYGKWFQFYAGSPSFNSAACFATIERGCNVLQNRLYLCFDHTLGYFTRSGLSFTNFQIQILDFTPYSISEGMSSYVVSSIDDKKIYKMDRTTLAATDVGAPIREYCQIGYCPNW